MSDPARKIDERFTYADYLNWPDGERWELIDGVAWAMSPAPTRRHQDILVHIVEKFGAFLRGQPCKVYPAPFDVLLPAEDEADDAVDTVVQPDLVVYCDKSKLTEKGARGAPDLVVEILSPSTQKKDLNEKFRLYEKHGVREYWVVDPGNRSIQVWHLGSAGAFDEGELRDLIREFSPISSKVLEGFSVDPVELFADLD